MEEDKYPTKLTKGSKYRITSRGSGDTSIVSSGEFMGYVQFGQDSGICIRLDGNEISTSGALRIIPTMAVLTIDIIVFIPEVEEKKNQPASVFYG